MSILDLLVGLVPGRDLFDSIAIKHGVEDFLGREVHLATEEAMRPSTRETVLWEAVPFWIATPIGRLNRRR